MQTELQFAERFGGTFLHRFRMFVATSLVALTLATGCGYGTVSPTTYEIAKSLYVISNRKLTDKLEPARKQIDVALQAETITDREAEWLRKIVKLGEQEQWQPAMKAARRIMEDQVNER